MKSNLIVSQNVEEAANLLINQFKGELISSKSFLLNNDVKIIVLVFNKYFIATKSEAVLVVTLDNTNGVTRLEIVSTGGGEGFLRWDYGSSKIIMNQVQTIFNGEIIPTDTEEPFKTMYFTNSRIESLYDEYHNFQKEHSQIVILDQFEELVKDDNNNDVYTLFITYLENE